MLVFLPLELKTRTVPKNAPIANIAIIALNVFTYFLALAFGWYWFVGPGTGPLSIVLYGFSHAGFWHLVFNMWALWVFGNPVNRRLGNFYYLCSYLGTIVILGLVARLMSFGPVLGASGGIFAVMTIAAMLMPAAPLKMAYGAVFPMSVLIGLFRKPEHGIYWFICGGQFGVRALLWLLLLVPCLELLALFAGWWFGPGGVWNLGHLMGMFCGVVAVLMLPSRITMPSGT
jgi:membrane associated rhomboid family serine protease